MTHIHNTLTREKEEFKPLKDDVVTMYVCGPTVYDSPHIGHARAAYSFDLIRRALKNKYPKREIKYIRNITDIDDKIIERAKFSLKEKEVPLTQASIQAEVKEVAIRYTDEYREAMKKLEIDPPRSPEDEPKATEYIPEIINFIQGLIDKGSAYELDGSVYFKVKTFPAYGNLSGQNPDEMREKEGEGKTFQKRDILDFALWKKSKPDEPFWRSPWSDGRPGWHIECSVMCKARGGTTIDIHGGGLDLVFPHHENELAQSESLSGARLANAWIHSGLLTIEGQKMSKSLGNFVSIDDFISKNGEYAPDLLKLIFLKSHYRSSVNYSERAVTEAKEVWDKFYNFQERLNQIKPRPEPESVNDQELLKIKRSFDEAMDDDFNTPVALAVLFDGMHYINKVIDGGKLNKEEVRRFAEQARTVITAKCQKIFGIFMDVQKISLGSDLLREAEEIKKEIDEARRAGKFDVSDQLRDKHADKWDIKNTKSGTIVRPKVI